MALDFKEFAAKIKGKDGLDPTIELAMYAALTDAAETFAKSDDKSPENAVIIFDKAIDGNHDLKDQGVQKTVKAYVHGTAGSLLERSLERDGNDPKNRGDHMRAYMADADKIVKKYAINVDALKEEGYTLNKMNAMGAVLPNLVDIKKEFQKTAEDNIGLKTTVPKDFINFVDGIANPKKATQKSPKELADEQKLQDELMKEKITPQKEMPSMMSMLIIAFLSIAAAALGQDPKMVTDMAMAMFNDNKKHNTVNAPADLNKRLEESRERDGRGAFHPEDHQIIDKKEEKGVQGPKGEQGAAGEKGAAARPAFMQYLPDSAQAALATAAAGLTLPISPVPLMTLQNAFTAQQFAKSGQSVKDASTGPVKPSGTGATR